MTLAAGCGENEQPPDVYLERAEAAMAVRNPAAAIRELKSVLLIEPSFVAARVKLAEIYLHLGTGSGAAAELEKAIQTLALTGSGLTLDLTNIGDEVISGIENIDIGGGGANTLNLDILDLLKLSETSNTLRIIGDANDAVVATANGGSWGAGVMGGSFTTFTIGPVMIEIDNDILGNGATSIA